MLPPVSSNFQPGDWPSSPPPAPRGTRSHTHMVRRDARRRNKSGARVVSCHDSRWLTSAPPPTSTSTTRLHGGRRRTTPIGDLLGNSWRRTVQHQTPVSCVEPGIIVFCLLPPKNLKFFKILSQIESLDVCIKY